ncbi:MAG TPA: FliH/SctL family protein [Polyangiaceae bacterium]|nr:FliH/SctL family protein [Polyangiaceae bacterium]
MSLSSDRGRPKSLRFVDVSAEGRPPGWLTLRHDEVRPLSPAERVDRLVPPEVPSHERPPLSPLLESVRPPPPRPSQFPGRPTPYPGTPIHHGQHASGQHASSQYPAAHFGSQFPSTAPGSPSQFPPGLEAVESFAQAAPEVRSDTMVEDLVPRAEEEAVAAIATAIDRFQRERQQALASVEGELIELVRAISRRVLLTEITQQPLLIERLVHAGLEALAGGDKLLVRLGPFFSEALPAIRESLEHRGVKSLVVVDPSVGRQGCQLSTELGRVDESVTTRLDVLLANLGLGS